MRVRGPAEAGRHARRDAVQDRPDADRLADAYRRRDCARDPSTPDEISAPPCEQLNQLATELRKSLAQARPRPKASWYSAYSRVLRSHLYRALAELAELDVDTLQRDVDAVVR